MLKNIKIQNFYSINKEQKISFEILPKDVLNDSSRLIAPDGQKGINLVSAIIGANASGKTNILKSFVFLFWFIENGYSQMKEDDSTGVEAFKTNIKEPTNIEIEFYNQEKQYQYRITLDSKRVISEYFWEKRRRKFSQIFEYDTRDKERWNLKTKIKINETDAKRFRERLNVSLLSSLIETGYLSHIRFFKDGVSNVTNIGTYAQNPVKGFLDTSEKLFKNEDLKNKVFPFTQNLDFGISGFDFKEATLVRKDKPSEEKKAHLIECLHNIGKNSFRLPLIEESNGTQNSIAMLANIFTVLEKGSIAIFDEIDAHLHPAIVRKIISLFENKLTNPKNAQLLFSTQQHLLLNDRTKTQIFITEKNNQSLETEIYRLDEIEGIRNDENYFHKYITGAYGGTPEIKWL